MKAPVKETRPASTWEFQNNGGESPVEFRLALRKQPDQGRERAVGSRAEKEKEVGQVDYLTGVAE